nr:hypothetical protein CFP56_24256 [Quercus suber]
MEMEMKSRATGSAARPEVKDPYASQQGGMVYQAANEPPTYEKSAQVSPGYQHSAQAPIESQQTDLMMYLANVHSKIPFPSESVYSSFRLGDSGDDSEEPVFYTFIHGPGSPAIQQASLILDTLDQLVMADPSNKHGGSVTQPREYKTASVKHSVSLITDRHMSCCSPCSADGVSCGDWQSIDHDSRSRASVEKSVPESFFYRPIGTFQEDPVELKNRWHTKSPAEECCTASEPVLLAAVGQKASPHQHPRPQLWLHSASTSFASPIGNAGQIPVKHCPILETVRSQRLPTRRSHARPAAIPRTLNAIDNGHHQQYVLEPQGVKGEKAERAELHARQR